jgi:hypothetical protein
LRNFSEDTERLINGNPAPDEWDLLLEKCRIDITDEYEMPAPLLNLEGEYGKAPVFTRENISMV